MWLFFAILAPICWGICNPIDSALCRNWFKNGLVLTCMVAFIKLPIAIVLLFLFNDGLFFGWPMMGMFVAGILWTLPFIWYYHSLEQEETSRVVLLMQVQAIFVLLLAAVLIGEKLDINQTFAFLLIFAGSIMAVIKKINSRWRFSKVFFLMLLTASTWALSDVMAKKYAVYFDNFWSAFSVDLLGSGLPALLLFLMPKYNGFLKDFWRLPRNGRNLFFITASLGTFGSLSFIYALTLGKAALTSVIAGLQPIFVLFFGSVLGRYIKEIPVESLSVVDLIIKGISFALMFLGLIWLYF